MHLNERVNGYCFSQYADPGNAVCGKGAVCCCSFVLIPILLIFAVIIAALLFVVTFVSGRWKLLLLALAYLCSLQKKGLLAKDVCVIA